MNKLGKFYFTEIRDQLGRYPNWPIGRKISLGQIGYLDGRNAEFDWRKTLADLGVNVASATAPSAVDELYSTEDSVRFAFTADSGVGSKAQFSFSRRRSVAIQGFQMHIASLDLGDLLAKLRTVIAANKNAWDWDWLIVTELWVGQAFTTLISGDHQSELSISATLPPPPPGSPFNIANPKFGLGVSSSNGMAYKGVAEQQTGSTISPFFNVHKLVDHPKKGLGLKKYADDSGWFWG